MVAQTTASVEYKVLAITAAAELEKALNDLAREGWEIGGCTAKVVILERR